MATKKRHQQQYIIGVDLGGTNIVVGAMSADGKHHYGMRSIPTSAELGAEGVADRIVGLIEGVILDTIAQTSANRRDFIGVGIGAPGPLDRDKGLVVDLGPRHAVANPLGVQLSGYPAKLVARGYHLYALPRVVNRWAVVLAYLTDVFFPRTVLSMGLVSEAEAQFMASEGIQLLKLAGAE